MNFRSHSSLYSLLWAFMMAVQVVATVQGFSSSTNLVVSSRTQQQQQRKNDHSKDLVAARLVLPRKRQYPSVPSPGSKYCSSTQIPLHLRGGFTEWVAASKGRSWAVLFCSVLVDTASATLMKTAQEQSSTVKLILSFCGFFVRYLRLFICSFVGACEIELLRVRAWYDILHILHLLIFCVFDLTLFLTGIFPV